MKKALPFMLLVCICTSAYGQQSLHPLDSIVVTANKFNQKASQTGKVVTVITQRELQHSSGKTLSAILNEQPGLSINGSGSAPNSYPAVYLRGADVQYTLIMIDGIPVQDVSADKVQFDLNLIPVSGIERIEIMRGGYAALYGSGAATGVINIITKKGGQRPFNGTLAFNGGSYHTFREEATIFGSKNKIDYNIHFQQMDTKGFSSALDTLGNQGFDSDGFHRTALFVNLGYHPVENWNIQPYFRFTDEKGDVDADGYADDKDYTNTSRLIQTGVQIEHAFPGGDLHINYSFNPVNRDYLNDTTDHSAYLKSGYKSFVHSADVYAHFIFGKNISMLAGVSGESMKTDQDMTSISTYGLSESHLSGDSVQIDALNAYGSFFIQSKSGFHLEAGGRMNHHKLYGYHPVFSLNPSWLIHEKVKVFVNVASTFSAPSLYQLYSIYGNTRLKPESGINYESGLEIKNASGQLNARLTGFARTMKDIIAFQAVDAGYQYVNYDHQRAYGGELEAAYTIGDRWHFRGWYAYADGRLTVKNGNAKSDSTYDNLFKRPKHTAGFSAGYQLTPGFYLSLDGKYTGTRKDLVFFGAQEVRNMDPYFLLNAYAQYVWKGKYKAFVGIYNILDSQYMDITGYATKGLNLEAGIQLSLH